MLFFALWKRKYTLFYKQRFFFFFSIQPQCCLTFSLIKSQVLLRCCLIPLSIIILRYLLYLLYLCPGLDLGLFMSHLCDLFFIFIFIFIIINLMNTDTLLFLFIFQNMSCGTIHLWRPHKRGVGESCNLSRVCGFYCF